MKVIFIALLSVLSVTYVTCQSEQQYVPSGGCTCEREIAALQEQIHVLSEGGDPRAISLAANKQTQISDVPTCSLSPNVGPCLASIPMYHYNPKSGNCEQFIYGGCQGNDNRFITKAKCEKECVRDKKPREPADVCSLSPDVGPCKAYMPRYFYNPKSGNCEQFIYGGCAGNDNKFITKAECKKECVRE